MQQNACLRSFLARRFLSGSLKSPIKTALLLICSPLGQGVRLPDKRTGICIYGSSLALKSYRSVSKCQRNAIFTVLGTPPQPIAIRLDNRTGVLYIRIMPSLQSYAVRGNHYWRIVESYRDKHGHPRLRVLRHLGTADKLLQLLSQAPGRPLCAEGRDFGATAALWDLARQLDLLRSIDAQAPKRKQGPSVGEYLLLATLNRALAPTSKRQLAAWYRNTILVRLLPLPPAALRSQRFWDHLHALDAAKLARIEEDLTRRLVEEWGVGLEALFYDTTNFDTFLSSENPAKLAKRGHAKSKRTDLRIVGLALLVSWDFHIPLFSQVYEGNQNDSVTFSGVLDDLVARYQMFRGKCENVTLVFDKGNNSTENFEELDDSPYHFIGSLVPSQHQDLLDIPLQKFHALDDPAFAGVRAYRTDLTDEQIIFGHRGQHHLERAFREMKDPYCNRFSPPRYWTDHMLRVHAFSCVLALTLVSLLHRRVDQAGVEITQSRLMEQLKGIKEITNYYPAQSGEKLRQGGRPRSERTLTRLDPQQEQIFRTLQLGRFLAG